MGTQHLRTSTVPALRRTLSRVVAQRRLPAHLVPNMTSALRRRLRGAAGWIRLLSPLRLLVRHRAGRGNPVVLTDAGWRVAGTTDATSARQLTAEHLAVAFDALESAGVEPFLAEPLGAARWRIGVLEHHRRRAQRALRRNGLEITKLRGRGYQRTRLRSRPSRLAVWRATHLGSGVAAERETAIEVEFWRPESIGHVVPDGRRGLASFIPDPAPGATMTVRDRAYRSHSTFALDLATRSVPFPIDVVYTWVDGSDPVWQTDYLQHLERAGGLNPEAANFSRYANRDELRYSMRSLWWNADFFRRVFLVTSGHLPAWLDQSHPRLTVVSHRDIFPPGVLPTFNSHAIESRLHLIEGLSEHYLYVNDDVFFGRPVGPELFFTPAGIARMFLSTAPIPPGPPTTEDAPVDAAAKNGQRLLDGAFGYRPARKLRHAPHPQIKSVLAETVDRFANEVEVTTASRFRSPSDVSLASSLAQHVATATGRAVVGDLVTQYINITDRWAPGRLADLTRLRNCDVFCLNETSMDGAKQREVDRMVAGFLARYFPRPSPFEAPQTAQRPVARG